MEALKDLETTLPQDGNKLTGFETGSEPRKRSLGEGSARKYPLLRAIIAICSVVPSTFCPPSLRAQFRDRLTGCLNGTQKLPLWANSRKWRLELARQFASQSRTCAVCSSLFFYERIITEYLFYLGSTSESLKTRFSGALVNFTHFRPPDLRKGFQRLFMD